MFNQFTGIGNLAADPESRFTQSGKQVASFTVCCDTGYGDNKHTEFVKCVAWEKTAESVQNYLKKGSKCMIQGNMKTRKWEDKDGNTRYSTEIIVQVMKILSPRSEGGQESSQPTVEQQGYSGPNGVPF